MLKHVLLILNYQIYLHKQLTFIIIFLLRKKCWLNYVEEVMKHQMILSMLLMEYFKII